MRRLQFSAMVKPVNDDDEAALEVDHDPGMGPDASLSDGPQLDLLDALMEERGRFPAAQMLGVNYRTLALCCDSRQVFWRMRRVLEGFRNVGGASGGATEGEDGGVVALCQRVSDLDLENYELRELMNGQVLQMEELSRRLTVPEDGQQSRDAAEVVDADVDDKLDDDHGDCVIQDWRLHRCRPGMLDASVVTLEEQIGEEQPLGGSSANLEDTVPGPFCDGPVLLTVVGRWPH